MLPHDQAKLDDIERDRRKREEALLLALLALIGQSRRDALAMLEHDMSYAPVMSKLQQRSSDTIARAMSDAYRAGYWRMNVLADAPDVPQRGPAVETWKDAEIGTLIALTFAFRPAADDAAQAIVDALTGAIESRDTTIRTDTALRRSFADAGYTLKHPARINSGVERNIITAHNGGMYSGAIESPRIEGLRHLSIIDGHETDICHERDGLALPIQHEYWSRGIPQLHWGCRSSVLPVFTEGPWSDWLPTIPPAEGFGYMSTVFLQRLGVAA